MDRGVRTRPPLRVTAGRERTLRDGPDLDVLGAFRADDGPPLLGYLTDPSLHVAELVAELDNDAEANLALAVETGVARPSAHDRERAVVLTLWSLGALVLHDHLRALLGDDLLDGERVPRGYLRGAGAILSAGVLTRAAATNLSGVGVSGYLANALAGLVEAPGPLEAISPFAWYLRGEPLVGGLDPAGTAALLGLTAVALAVAVVGFARRDLGA